jgi:aminopeptidase 2
MVQRASPSLIALNLNRKIPLNILTVNDSGEVTVQRQIVMTAREETYEIDTTKPYKLNAGTSGVCESYLMEALKGCLSATDRVLYTPERITTLGKQCSQANSPFSVTDRMGLISDVMQLGKSGLLQTSAGLSLIHEIKGDTECESLLRMRLTTVQWSLDLVWDSIATRLGGIAAVWWEMDDSTRANMNAFRRVRFPVPSCHLSDLCHNIIVPFLSTGEEVGLRAIQRRHTGRASTAHTGYRRGG